MRSSRIVGACALSLVCGSQVWAAFAKIDDFQSYPAASLLPNSPTTYWTSSSTIAAEENPNKYLYNTSQTRSSNNDPALLIPDGSTGTLFFRFVGGGSPNVIGLAAAPHEGYMNDTVGLNLYSTGVAAFSGSFYSDNWPAFQWYNAWLVINNSTDTFDAYIQGGASGPFVNLTQIGANLPFQSGAEGLPLRSFNVSHGGFFDDIYADSGGVNLSNPTVPEPAGAAFLSSALMLALGRRMKRGSRGPVPH
jgi:hypothetical protein